MNHLKKNWKKTLLWTAPLIMGVIGFILGWMIFGQSMHNHAETPEVDAKFAYQETDSEQMYTCSMHPQIRTSDPDEKCPICGMDLIPVPADDEPDMGNGLPRLHLSQHSAALMQIQVWPVESRQMIVPLRLYGRLAYDETRLRTIAAWVPGRLDRLYVDYTGTLVRKGQPMVEIFSPKLIAAQEELLQAIRAAGELKQTGSGLVLKTTLMTVDASYDRLRLLGLAEEQIKRIEKQGRVEDRLVIPSPLSGVVIERLASTGDYVETGQPVYRLADLSHLWVQLEVYESDLQWLALGQKLTFSTQSYPGKQFEGTVSFIDPVLNDRTRTIGVRIDIPNSEGLLRPGMFVRGVLGVDTGYYHAAGNRDDNHDNHRNHGNNDRKEPMTHHKDKMPLVIPDSAPLITGERAVVYVQIPETEKPTFEPRDIVLGPRVGRWYIVSEGLKEGDLVVTNGSFKIDSELQIRGRPSMMQPEGGVPPRHDHGGAIAHAAEMSPKPAAESGEGISFSFREQLGLLVRANFGLVKALAEDDLKAAQLAARQAAEELHRIEPGKLISDHQLPQWNHLSKTLHESLNKIAESEDLGVQRQKFETFSDALTEAVRTYGVEDTGPVYRAVCPMVQGRRGYWLQPHEHITNPYFGAIMLTCGEIAETLVEPGNHH